MKDNYKPGVDVLTGFLGIIQITLMPLETFPWKEVYTLNYLLTMGFAQRITLYNEQKLNH